MAVMATDHSIADYSSESDWNTAIAAGDVEMVKKVAIEIPERTPNEVDANIGGEPSYIASYTHTLVCNDANSNATNDLFYNALRAQTVNIAYKIGDSEIGVVTAKCRASTTEVQPLTKTEVKKYMTTFTWEAEDLPTRYAAPANVFD